MSELILLENCLINFIVLKTTSLLTKERAKFLILSSFFNGISMIALQILSLNKFGQLLFTLGFATITICISFKFKTLKKFLRLFSIYYVSNFVYGGACYFFSNLFSIKSFLLILCVIIATFLIIGASVKHFSRKMNIDKFCYEIEIEVDGQRTKWKAFLDSGNLLTDPITSSPVNLINFKVFSTIYNQVSLEDLIKGNLKNVKFAHYIHLNTLGGRDKILAFQVDKLIVGEKILNSVTLGLCLKNFKESFDSDVILNNSFAV